MIYIYGVIDIWIVIGVFVFDKVDVKWFVMEGKDYGSVCIGNMSEVECVEFL